MVRNFAPRPLPPETMERILANTGRGPSAGFTQGVDLLVLEGPEHTGRFWAAVSPDRGFATAGWLGG